MIKEKLEKVKEKRAPWLPFLWRPRFTYNVPKIDFSIERNRLIGFFVVLIMASVLFGGLIYVMVELPPPLVTVGRRPGFIYPSSRGQTANEVFIVSALLALGSLGFLLVRRSSEKLTADQEVEVDMYAGFTLILIAVVGILIIYLQKMQTF